MTDFVLYMLFIIAVLGLAFLALYLPSLVITRLLFHFRRGKGHIMRFLSYPIGPSVPGRGGDRTALRRALGRWVVLGLKTVLLAILLATVSGYALFIVVSDSWLTTALVLATGAALLASFVSGVECVFLLVRLVLHGSPNPTDSLALRDNLGPHNDRVNSPGGPRPPFSRVRLNVRRAPVNAADVIGARAVTARARRVSCAVIPVGTIGHRTNPIRVEPHEWP